MNNPVALTASSKSLIVLVAYINKFSGQSKKAET